MKLNIAINANNEYFYLTYVMLYSLFKHNKNNKINLYVMYDNTLEDFYFNKFDNFKKYENCESINYIKIDISKYNSFQLYNKTLYCIELAEIIKENVPEKYRRNSHPARKAFQAIRIEVNNEIKPLEKTVADCIDVLAPKGRLCIITFHSLEDRAVKKAYIDTEGKCTCPKDLPYCICNYKSYGKIITKKPIIPSQEEMQNNSRAKSAKLRVFEAK